MYSGIRYLKKGAIIVLVLVLVSPLIRTGSWYETREENRFWQPKIKSGSLSVDYSPEQVLSDIERLGLNTITVPVMVLVENVRSSYMELDRESVDKAVNLIQILKKSGIGVILEPYPWIDGGRVYETVWDPEDPRIFFQQWRERVIAPLIKEIAIPLRTEAFCMGANLVKLEGWEGQWLALLKAIRKLYGGAVTYRVNWWATARWEDGAEIKENTRRYDALLKSGLLAQLDFISIAAYFELSDKPVNTVKDLEAALVNSKVYSRGQNILGEIQALHAVFDKPIFFGELGFPRREHAATQPWNPEPSPVEDGSEQARCFEAYRRTFTMDWFLGFSVFAVGNRGEDKNFYPSEESARIIRDWFAKSSNSE